MDETGNQIIRNLDEQVSLCTSLLESLSQEEAHLRKNEFTALEKIIAEKATIVAKLETAANIYIKLRKQAIGEEGTEQELLSSPVFKTNERKVISDKLEELKELSKQCQFKNDVNGRVIAVNANMNQQLVNLLKGIDDNATVYDASGKMGN